MMMDRRHTEDPFAMCQFEIANLQHDGDDLDQVDKSDQDQENRHLQQKCSLKKIDGKWKITRSIASTY